jgi:hypothetical protein
LVCYYFEPPLKKEVFFALTLLFRIFTVNYTEMNKLRKEVQLEQEIIDKLTVLAEKKQWSLKKMMETILIKAVKNVTLEESNS